jgi:hypothetical protein
VASSRRKSAVSYDRTRPAAQNLVGLWPFAEGGGLLARDVVGRAGHLTLTAPVWGKGPWGDEVVFDGSSTKGVLADNPNLELPSTQVTLVTAWVITANPTDQTPYAGKRVGYQSYTFGFQSRVFNSFTDTQAWLNVGSTSYTTTNGFNSLSLNTPYILTLRWKSGDYLNIRIFDVLGNVVYDQNSATTITGSLTYDTGPLFVGYHENSDTTGSLYMPGRCAFTLLSARAWGDNELHQFARQPLLAPRRRRVSLAASSSLSGTIAAVSSLTGSIGSATSYSTVAAGSWATSANWSPAGVPGDGDSVTINHAITSSTDKTIGGSGVNGTAAIIVNGSGSLTLSSGSTLTAKGDIVLNNATLTMGAGTTIEMNSAGAATPAATHYGILIGQAHNQSSARLVANGVNGNRCVIRSNAGGGNGYITDSGFLNGGLITATYTLFIRMGDSANDNLFSANSSGTYSITNSSLDTCGRFTSTYNNSSDCSVTFQHNVWKNSLGSECLRILGNSPGSYSSGTRLIDDCSFDKPVAFFTGEHYTVTSNYFWASYDANDAAWYLFDGNWDYKTTATETPVPASASNNYRVIDGAALTNPHFLQFRAYARDVTIDGDVFQFTGTDGQGDCILTPSTNPAAPQTYTVTRCIMLKNGGSDCSGTPFTFFGNQSNVSLNFHHNTFYTGSQGGAVGETGGGYANTLTCRDNSAWDDAGVARGYLLFDSGTNDSVTDLVPSSLADYNNVFGLLASYVNLEFSSGSPGAHDQAVNPQYADSARRIETWDASLGGPGTVAHAIAELKKRNDPSQTYNSNYTVAALLTYVKAGFAPKNQALKNADHTGSGDIGAVAVSAVSTSLSGTIAAVSALTGALKVSWYLQGQVTAIASFSGTLVSSPATRANFLIGTADIPIRAKLITPSLTFDDDYDFRNLFFGERERVAQLLTASTTQTEIVFTLGSGNGRAVEFLYLAQGAMLLENGVTGAYLQGSNDGTTWTSIIGRSSSLSGATLLGQDLRDLMFTAALNDIIAGATTSQFTFWKLILAGGTSKRPLSKAFFGQWLDMGEPDTYDWEAVDGAADAWLAPRGNKLMAKTATERLKFTVQWDDVTDAKAQEFEQTLLLNAYQNKVVLYTQSNHAPLANRRVVHCKVVDEECEITPLTIDVTGVTHKSVKAVFEELV